jgi:hypothetical protein
MKRFPDSLETATPADGHALAHELAQLALAEPAASNRDMAAHLSAPPPPSVEMLAAAYFQTVAVANAGWQR